MCSSVDEWIKKMSLTHTHTHTHIHTGISFNHGKKEILPLTTTWMKLEGIMFSEMSDIERKLTYVLTYVWNLFKTIFKKS